MSIKPSELKTLKAEFNSFDADGDGFIDKGELKEVLGNLQMDGDVDALFDEVDANKNGLIEWDEFLNVIRAIKSGKKSTDSGFAKVYSKQKDLVNVKGVHGTHSYAVEEMTAFSEHFNTVLKGDEDLDHLLPIEIDEKDMDLCRKVNDGLLLSKFINVAVPDTIDVRALNRKKKGKNLSKYQIGENQILCINAAKSIGVQVINVGPEELQKGESNPHLVLGIVWQLVKIQLLNSINLKAHPELILLLEDGETLEDLLRLPPEQLLLRWFNYHLRNAGHDKRVRNFSGDVKDSTAYTVLLNQIAPNTCDKSALKISDKDERAQAVLDNAEKLDVHAFIKSRDIVSGNSRLNLAFTAAIFNKCPGLEVTQEEIDKAGLMDDDEGDSREERAFRMWINSLGIDDLYINNLFDDLRDGLVLLRVLDHIEPGIVNWKKVEKKTNFRIKKVSNCNYAVELGKQLKFSLVNIGGIDITDGNKKLILGLVWQMMRYHTLKFLAAVNKKKFGGKPVDDQMIIDWANSKTKGRAEMKSYKDKSLASGVFFLELLRGIEGRIIDDEYVTAGDNDEDALLNARYAISVARKMGAVIFLLPEDIVEVKPKMIMTFVASCMSLDS